MQQNQNGGGMTPRENKRRLSQMIKLQVPNNQNQQMLNLQKGQLTTESGFTVHQNGIFQVQYNTQNQQQFQNQQQPQQQQYQQQQNIDGSQYDMSIEGDSLKQIDKQPQCQQKQQDSEGYFIPQNFKSKNQNTKQQNEESNIKDDREIDPKDYKFSEEQINNFKQKGILKEDKTIDQYIIPPNQIEIRETIGRGSGGVVKLAVDKITGVQFALKEMSVNLSPEFQKQLDIELHVLMKCKHPNIIKCYGASLNNGQIQIAMEYMDFGTLDNLGQMFGKLDQEVLGPIFVQCLKGLDYLHSDLKIIHRDIKPQNILINKQGEVKLTDFGVSGKISTQQNQKNTWTGTVTYMAPERIIGESYGTDSDLWSLGITMLELATGKYPYSQFQYNTFWQLLETIQQNQPPELPDDYDDKDLRDVLNHCLCKDPKQRQKMTTKQLYNKIKYYEDSVPMLSQWLDPVYE